MKNNLRGIFVNAYKMLILEWLKLFITQLELKETKCSLISIVLCPSSM